MPYSFFQKAVQFLPEGRPFPHPIPPWRALWAWSEGSPQLQSLACLEEGPRTEYREHRYQQQQVLLQLESPGHMGGLGRRTASLTARSPIHSMEPKVQLVVPPPSLAPSHQGVIEAELGGG